MKVKPRKKSIYNRTATKAHTHTKCMAQPSYQSRKPNTNKSAGIMI